MQISQNNCYPKPNFKAKWFHSESLRLLADYASENGKFDKLNEARKKIDKAYFKTRLRLDMGLTDDNRPFVTFTRFMPKASVIIPKSMEDYKLEKSVLRESSKPMNPLKYAYEMFIKLSNNAPHNKLFKNVVVMK